MRTGERGIVEPREVTVRRKEGAEFPAQLVVAEIAYGGRRLFSWTFHDLTDRHAVDAERKFVASLVDTVRALIVVLDPEGRILRFNRACEDLTGYSAAEVAGRRVSDVLIPEEEREEVREVFEELTAGALHNRHENAWIAKDGSSRWISWSNAVVTGERGEILYVVGTGLDLTDKREMELKAHRAMRMESLGQLAGGIAHDFDNYLMSIRTMSEACASALPPGGRARTLAERIHATAKRAGELTHQLLVYAGRAEPVLKKVDLAGITREMSELLELGAAHKVAVRRELEPVPLVLADAAQLRQVLLNLVTNAADACKGRDGRVALRTGVVEAHEDDGDGLMEDPPPDGRYAYVEVEDDGCGMDAETVERMFDPFFTTKPEGHGLGLAAVMGIVQRHGGTLSVRSTPGEGTCIRVLFPCDEAPL